VNPSPQFLGPAEAARRLGVSAKALRLYEKRGLVTPLRTASGWRAYGPEQMERAAAIAALRGLGLGLTEVRTMLESDDAARAAMLATHQASLEAQSRELGERIAKLRRRRAGLGLAGDATPPSGGPAVAFDLPWPWGGEGFELAQLRPLTFIVGPLFSGKTRLAKAIAARLPGCVFIGLDRSASDNAMRDAALDRRIERTVERLVAAGASKSAALDALVAAVEAADDRPLVIDMVEQGLDGPSQAAVIAYLRRRARLAGPLFVTTRSTAILDPDAAGPEEEIIFCPANHSPPLFVAPFAAAPGFAMVASCLGTPEARTRTEGVIAIRTKVA
jgi:DNA-binding transcriptional MerR regulator